MSQVSHMSQSENQTNITKWKEQKEVKSRQFGGDRNVNWGIVTHEHVAQENVY
jgi:hypothetical protein